MSKDNLFEDYPWTIGYYLTLQNNTEHEYLFPSFEEHIVDANDEADSKVSQVFTRCYKLIHEISERYIMDKDELVQIEKSLDEFFIDELHLNPKVKQHGAKKLGIQTLGDLLTISIQDISMRGGWALKAFNTFFDYWVGSLPGSVRSGKMIAGWRQVSTYCILKLTSQFKFNFKFAKH